LLLYEPWLLVLVATGLVMQVIRRGKDGVDRRLWCLVLWSGLAAGMVMVRPGSEPEMLGAVVLPAALYGGAALATVLRPIPDDALRWSGLHGLVAFVFWLPGLLALAQYAGNAAYAQDVILVVLGIVVLVGLQILLSFLFVLLLPPQHLWRSALLGLSLLLALIQVSFGAGLAYVRDTSPLEPAVAIATSDDVRHLRALVDDIAVMRNQRRDEVEVVLLIRDETLASPVRWALRDFERLTLAAAWPADPAALVITPMELDGPGPGDPADGPAADWRGAPFVAATTYTAPLPACDQLWPPACTEAVGWYLYRSSPYPATPRNVILWQTGDAVTW
jgi:hypothetical protein